MAALSRGVVTTSQTALNSSTATLVAAAADRTFVEIKNTDAAITIYIGGSTVTSSTGYPLKAGEAVGAENVTAALYAISASGTPTAAVIQW